MGDELYVWWPISPGQTSVPVHPWLRSNISMCCAPSCPAHQAIQLISVALLLLQEKGGEAAQWTAGKAGEAGGVIADKAGDVAQDVRGKADEAKDHLSRKGREVADKAADKAGQVTPPPPGLIQI